MKRRLQQPHSRKVALPSPDMQVHGHDRAGELADAMKDGTVVVVERHERITGYATVLAFFGHAVAETNLDLQALIASAEAFAGPGIIVPTRNSGLFRWCLEVERIQLCRTDPPT
jgi:hypothetical protein